MTMAKLKNGKLRRKDGVWDPLKSSSDDRQRAEGIPKTPQSDSPSYRLAFNDPDFLCREELRPVRLQLELLKTEMMLAERGIKSTVVMFGGAVGGRKSAKGKAEERQRELDLAYVERRVEFMRKHQRPPDKTERDEILRGMATKLVVDGEAKLAYQVDQKEYRNVDTSGIVVPDDDRREIIAAFTRANVEAKKRGERARYPITDEAIKRFYLLQSGALVGGE